MRLALGPLLYYWPRSEVLAFYRDVLTWPVEIVYLGEVVCSRRHELRLTDWLDIASTLAAAGKEVVLSALALPESETDLRLLRRLIVESGHTVEANDMSAVQIAAGAKAPFVIGPHLNVYNGATLAALRACGAARWVAPVETSRQLLAQMQQCRPEGLATEVFAYGRLPLAFSARCFTARAHELPKDDCRFCCLEHPDGLLAETRDGEPLFAFNGIQTQSAKTYNLLPAVADLKSLGVDVVRVSPQSSASGEVIARFREVLDGALTWQQGYARLPHAAEARYCDGFWHGRPALEQVFGVLTR